MTTKTQMVLKISILFGVCLLTIDVSNGITQEELCGSDTNNPIKNFRVEAAFKFQEFLGLIGKMWRKDETEANSAVAVRVTYWHQPDPSGHSPNKFYEIKLWNEILEIDRNKTINMAFSTRGVNVFPNQKELELVFLVQDTNLTTAYRFNEVKVRNMSEPTFDHNMDKRVVYDPIDNWDDSGYLRVKYLFLHFPYELKILAILIFERKKIEDKEVYRHGDEVLKKTFSDNLHHAIVYTEEKVGTDKFFYRHYLRAERHDYRDDASNSLVSLDWFFDQNIDFCDRIDVPPTAVALLRKEDENWYLKGTNEHRNVIHFIEFYGTKHKIMKITFMNARSDSYIVNEESNEPIDNAVAFTHCKPHPAMVKSEPITCADYPQDSGAGNILFWSQQFSTSDSNKTFIYIAIVITIVLILVLIGIFVVSFLKN